MLAALNSEAETTISSGRFIDPSSGDKIKISDSTKTVPDPVLFLICPLVKESSFCIICDLFTPMDNGVSNGLLVKGRAIRPPFLAVKIVTYSRPTSVTRCLGITPTHFPPSKTIRTS